MQLPWVPHGRALQASWKGVHDRFWVASAGRRRSIPITKHIKKMMVMKVAPIFAFLFVAVDHSAVIPALKVTMLMATSIRSQTSSTAFYNCTGNT
jgi:hypothetical protein